MLVEDGRIGRLNFVSGKLEAQRETKRTKTSGKTQKSLSGQHTKARFSPLTFRDDGFPKTEAVYERTASDSSGLRHGAVIPPSPFCGGIACRYAIRQSPSARQLRSVGWSLEFVGRYITESTALALWTLLRRTRY
jgi:hypothetical protein